MVNLIREQLGRKRGGWHGRIGANCVLHPLIYTLLEFDRAQYVEKCKIVGQRKVASSSGAAGGRSTNQIAIQIGLFPVSLQFFPSSVPLF